MKNLPVLDRRGLPGILEDIREKAKSYAPEWRYDPQDMDAGGALAQPFGEMFFETVDRFNRVPYKNYIEFLNMLDVRRNPATPSTAYVQFEANAQRERGVLVRRGTQVYADDPDGQGEDVIFETVESFDATAAQLTELLLVDAAKDCIEPIALQGEPVEIFEARPGNSIQKHAFCVGEQAALALRQPCKVELFIQNAVSSLTGETAHRLADGEFAVWEYYDGRDWRAFDGVAVENSHILLEKRREGEIAPMSGEGARILRCTMSGGENQADIIARSIALRTALLNEEGLPPDELSFNDAPIELPIGGYCFGRAPVGYDCFYISSSEILSKKKARVKLSLEMKTILVQQLTPEEQYQFNKFIIDKNEKMVTVPKIFISDIVWEYWNGIGWRRLPVGGDANPFSCEKDGGMSVTFLCPDDMSPVEINAKENYWIRARVAFVENSFSTIGDRLLPFIQDARLTYEYGDLLPVDYAEATNNCETVRIEDAAQTDSLGLLLYRPLPPEVPCLYLGFDQPFMGYPVNLYLDVEGQVGGRHEIEYQVWTGSSFEKLRTVDTTASMTGGGTVGLFMSDPAARGVFFGREGYWLRVLDVARRFTENPVSPCLRAILPNAVRVVQTRREPEEVFPSDIYEAERRVFLNARPVLSCEVWINEFSDISAAERSELLEEYPDRVRARYDSDDQISAFYVRWEQVPSFGRSGPRDRHYVLDPIEGALSFGDGRRGKVPSVGGDSITVRYTTGGGSRGNVPAGGIQNLVGSIANIVSVQGFTPACGGNDVQSVKTVESLGPRRVRHRYRAVSAGDYEDIVRERFSEAADVRCFPHTNSAGEEENGAVAVVVMAAGHEDRDYSRQLCRRVERMLRSCCDCMPVAGGKLYVVPAMVVTVNVTVSVDLDSYDNTADVEREVLGVIERCVNPALGGGSKRGIGVIPGPAEYYAALKHIAHVTAVREVMIEGSYYENNQFKLVHLDGKNALPFAVVKNGAHRVRM